MSNESVKRVLLPYICISLIGFIAQSLIGDDARFLWLLIAVIVVLIIKWVSLASKVLKRKGTNDE